MELKDRIKKLRGHMTRFEFSSKIGSSPSAIQGWERGSRMPKADALLKIHDALRVSIDWLLTGKGQMYERQSADEAGKIEGAEKAGGTEYILENGTPKEIATQTTQTGHPAQSEPFIRIPTVLSRLKQEGDELVFEESAEEAYAFRKDWAICMATHIGNLVLLNIRSDSMEPLICSGDVVMVDKGLLDINEGSIYAIAVEDMVYLKKLVLMPTGKVKVISENKDAYEPFEMNRKDLRILGEVVWFSRQLG